MEIMYFDGGCKPNPGIMEVCVYHNGVGNHQQNLGHGTNNQAEWLSFLLALEMALEQGISSVRLRGDSMLVVNQANEKWKVHDATLKDFFNEFKKLKKRFTSIVVEYIPRERNYAGMIIEREDK